MKIQAAGRGAEPELADGPIGQHAVQDEAAPTIVQSGTATVVM
jgi:hypothetical protein